MTHRNERHRVAVHPVVAYDRAVLTAVVRQIFAAYGLPARVRGGTPVLLKPNLIAPRPSADAVCTHPEVVRAVAAAVIDCGGRPCVGDSPGYAPLSRCIEKSGLKPVLDELAIGVVPFSAAASFPVPDHRLSPRIELAAALADFPVIINLPKLKTHGLMGLTLAVKNLFGCVPGIRKAGWHYRAGHRRELFARMLLDIHAAVCPALHLLDGIVGMEGDGPTRGRPVPVGLLAAAADGPALDWTVEGLLKYPETTPLIAAALDDGSLDPARITVDNHGFTAPEGPLKPARSARATARFPLHSMLRRLVVRRPRIAVSRCRRCGVCVKHCPAGAMKLVDGRVRIDYKTCIRCYCCHELCPYDAVRVGWVPGWIAAAQVEEEFDNERTDDAAGTSAGAATAVAAADAPGRAAGGGDPGAGTCNNDFGRGAHKRG
ncbi:MAG: DUF362 domain-containing protein [Deltaproteobacteria bacterium]|nr:DUF362 domain-containing protein [Candidatus Anaeroferrophillacea bacterium]